MTISIDECQYVPVHIGHNYYGHHSAETTWVYNPYWFNNATNLWLWRLQHDIQKPHPCIMFDSQPQIMNYMCIWNHSHSCNSYTTTDLIRWTIHKPIDLIWHSLQFKMRKPTYSFQMIYHYFRQHLWVHCFRHMLNNSCEPLCRGMRILPDMHLGFILVTYTILIWIGCHIYK